MASRPVFELPPRITSAVLYDMYYAATGGILTPVPGFSGAGTGAVPTKQGDGSIAWAALSTGVRDVRMLPIVDGGGAVITAGSKGILEVPAGTLVAARLLGDALSGSIAVDLRRTTYANYAPGTHPVSGDSIIGGGTALAITAAAKYQDTAFTSWTSTTFSEGDLVEIVVTGSPTTFTRVSVILVIRRP